MDRRPAHADPCRPSHPRGQETARQGFVTIDLESLADLTHPIRSGMAVSAKERPVLIERRMTHREHGVCASSIEMGSHTGTHLDAPLHFHQNAAATDQLPLRSLITTGCVLDLRTAPPGIDAALLQRAAAPWGGLASEPAALIWTGWDRHFGRKEMHAHPYLTDDAARALVDAGVTLVGIDALGVDDSLGSRYPAHELLLGAGIPIVENLRGLEALGAGPCGLAIIPLLLEGVEAAPVRAFGWRLS